MDAISTCKPGQEKYEEYYSSISNRPLVQYEYRTPDGKLFATIKKDLETCRATRLNWLVDNGYLRLAEQFGL